MALFKCSNLSFSYKEDNKVLSDIDFSINYGQLITLLGPNGVGKTTFLNCIIGLLKPTSGDILLNDINLYTMSRKSIAKNIAYVPQKCIVPFDYCVKEFVVMGRTAHLGIFSGPSSEDYRSVDDALHKLEIEHLAERPINELSGGEQQKAFIAQAIVQSPQLIILDEPTSALDYGNQIKVLSLIKELSSAGYAVLMTTHNPDHTLMLGGDVAILNKNGLLTCGNIDDILTEDNLEKAYATKLKLMYIEELNRKICVPYGL